jgi:O-antigen/teichoic acid export membrane protein
MASDSGPSTGPSIQTKVARGVAWSAAAQALIAIGDIVSLFFVTALIPTSDLGISGMAYPFYTMLDVAADLGITASLIQRDDHTPERVSTVFWFNLLVSTGLFLIVLVAAPLYGWLIGVPLAGWLLVAYGSKLIFQNVYVIPFALLKKELRFSEIAIARLIAHLAESVARIVFAVMGVTVWCFTLAAFVRAFVFGVIMQIRHPFIPKLVFRPREVLDYVRFGIRSGASQILYQFYTNVDYAIVGHYFGSEANGIYFVAYSIVLEPVRTITNVVNDVAFPTFARIRSQAGDLPGQFIKFSRLNLIAVVPFIVVLLLVVPDLLASFYLGGKHGERNWTHEDLALVADAVYILCFVGVLRAIGFLGPPLLDGLGHPERTLRYMVVAAITMPTMFILGANLLGARLGLLSVAVAWAVGYPLAFAVLAWLIVGAIKMSVSSYAKSTRGVLACCVAGYGAGEGVELAVGDLSPGLRMIVVGGTALVVILGLLAATQDVTPKGIAKAIKGSG